MRIAFVTSHINRSNQWNWFSENLKQRNIFHLHIIINHYEPLMLADIRELGIPVVFLKHKNIFSFVYNYFRVLFLLRKYKIDIVHTELPYGNLIGQLAASTCFIRNRVLTCESLTWGIDYNNRKQKINDWLSLRLTKKVIALTALSKKFLVDRYNLKKEDVLIIHHALKANDYLDISPARVEALRSELQIPADRFVIGLVSRFVYWKGIEYAVKAMIPVVQMYPEALLLIFGDKEGESFAEISSLIAKHSLQDHIKHVGYVADNVALYTMLDVQIHVPVDAYVETFGIVIIEGMISGCPQILTLTGISNDSARDGENCILVDHCSANQISEAIILLRENPALRKKLSVEAKADAIRMFQYDTKVERHITLYKELLD